MNLELLLQQATPILEKFAGESVALSHPVVLKEGLRCHLVRCQVQSASVSSVIIKQVHSQPAQGFTDWASLELLSSLSEAESLAPRFYGGDIETGCFLMEDLGKGCDLETVLTTGDSAQVRSALNSLAITMARLHGATREQEDIFRVLRSRLPRPEKLNRHCEAKSWFDNKGKIFDWLDALNLTPPPGLERSLGHIARTYNHPGEFLTFTHGDPAPSNNHFQGSEARLLDFEYGGYRHALYDISAWQILCPLPEEYFNEMLEAFRRELSEWIPMAQDEALFRENFAAICAYRAFAILSWIPPDILWENRPWAGSWTMRQAVLAATLQLEGVVAPHAALGSVTEVARQLSGAMRQCWPELGDLNAILPPWPALKRQP